MRYLYVMVSRTDTGFARLIRRFTGCYYNHAAISFDCDLRQLYSFARRAYECLPDPGEPFDVHPGPGRCPDCPLPAAGTG